MPKSLFSYPSVLCDVCAVKIDFSSIMLMYCAISYRERYYFFEFYFIFRNSATGEINSPLLKPVPNNDVKFFKEIKAFVMPEKSTDVRFDAERKNDDEK